MRWMHDAGRSVVGAVAVAGAMSLAGEAAATVSTTLVADTYLVLDGGKVYSVLDVYVSGSHLGDVMSSVTGLNGTAGHEVIFATSKATGVTRDATTGKITGGAITSDAFVQAGNSSWNPTYVGAEAWDSFIANGNRRQNAKVTNRAGTLIDLKSTTWGTSTTFGGGQMNTANSNFIENGGGSGWLNTLGSNPYLSGTSAITSENPFARVSVYSNDWAAVYNYTDLDRSGSINKVKGRMQSGRATGSGTPVFSDMPGDPLDSTGKYRYMIGRFAIDVTNDATPVTMQVQFNMVGRNGTGNDVGPIFTGASTASYKVSQFFSFDTAPAPPVAPAGISATDGTLVTGVTVSWNQVFNATSYRVMRSEAGGTPVEVGTTTTQFSYVDTTAAPGVLYAYSIYAINSLGSSPLSGADDGWRRLMPPASVTASDGAAGGRVRIAWAASTGATRYKVLRSIMGGTAVQVGITSELEFFDATGVPRQVYQYSVRASCALGDSDASGNESGYSIVDCNNNGVDDPTDLDPPVTITTGNMGTLVGLTQRSSTQAVASLPTTSVTVAVDAAGDLNEEAEYLILRLSTPTVNPTGIVRNLFVKDGQGCPSTPQRTTFTLTAAEFSSLMGNNPGSLKIDITPTIAVGGADSTCQAQSSVSVTISYLSHSTSLDADGNGVLDSCEWLAGSPAFPTIASAMAAAPAGSVVPVLPGSYAGPIDLGAKNLQLRSIGGRGVTTIRAAAGTSTVRVQGSGSIEGFTILGGTGDTENGVRRGGAMRITAGAVQVLDCELRGGDVGSSGEGGLVYVRDASPTFQNCTLEAGVAASGGGVFAFASTGSTQSPTFTDCVLARNTASSGGAMYLSGGGMTPLLYGVRFTGNRADSAGNVIRCVAGARPVLAQCVACDNAEPLIEGAFDQINVNWLTQDCNNDGFCDGEQLQAGQLVDSEPDGVPDVCVACTSDLDGNRTVDTADVSLLLLDFGPCGGCPSDLDGSGTTDTADLSLLLLDFGACP